MPLCCPKNPQCCLEASKSSWPELLGQNADSAKAAIKKDNPLVTVIPLPAGSISPDISRSDRVYVSIDENGNVAKVPPLDSGQQGEMSC
ncbi:hypothetical protein EUGRSUZ_F00210 [Eucalyptus grandis]|uniref:Uncharacterized protein n=2 Tax=Eucalyptus grandis TaxID=71139 RepID=A0ACC3KAW9_EUCGR|nr:hypothetical protein EUGRSUZ_F00210 [Eucalyptus grandis]